MSSTAAPRRADEVGRECIEVGRDRPSSDHYWAATCSVQLFQLLRTGHSTCLPGPVCRALSCHSLRWRRRLRGWRRLRERRAYIFELLEGSVHLAEIKFGSVLTTKLTQERRAARRRGTEAGGTQHRATRTREIARGAHVQLQARYASHAHCQGSGPAIQRTTHRHH